ncbi:MAG: hypothetical protein ACO3CQ_00115 [Candidatus Nanopelagicaceae bacterium]
MAEIIINSGSGDYVGRRFDVQLSAELRHREQPIFEKFFLGGSESVVDLSNDTIFIPNHFFRTGEELTYEYDGFLTSTNNAVGIASTEIPNIGIVTTIPTTVYAVKLNDRFIKLSATKEGALKRIPDTLDLNSLGFGTYHKFIGEKQNTRTFVTIDNVVQSPTIDTNIKTQLVNNLSGAEDLINVTGVTSFFSGDLIRIDNEIMRINYVKFAGNNNFIVRRPMLGSKLANHQSGSDVVKLSGNYQIFENTIYFPVPPFEKSPTTDFERTDPEDRDYVGLETFSTFDARVFLRSGFEDTSIGPYDYNFLLDDISQQFTGISTQAILTERGENVAGFSTGNALVLINNVFQTPDFIDYGLSESAGITTIKFTGSPSSNPEDINTASIPRGGIIVSVGTKPGLGYQPLVAAGGTAKVSYGGTIESIFIGYSGSGYRAEKDYIFETEVSSPSFGPNDGTFYLKDLNGIRKKLDYLYSQSYCSLSIKDSIGRNTIENNGFNQITSVGYGETGYYVQISNPVDAWIEVDDSSGFIFVKSTSITSSSGISTNIIEVSSVSGIDTTSESSPYYLNIGTVAKNIEIIDVDQINNLFILATPTTDGYVANTSAVVKRFESGIDRTNINDVAYVEIKNPTVGIANIYVNVLKEYPVENATYTHTTGIVTITSDQFSTSPGEIVEIRGLIYKCNSGGTSEIPSSTFNKIIGISSITVNRQLFTVSNATYDPASGISTLTIGSHSLPLEGRIYIEPESLGFTCTLDGNSTTTFYPRPGDPAYDSTVGIASTTATTIVVNVGSAGTNTSLHTFVPSGSNQVRYSTGITTITTDSDVDNTLITNSFVLFKDTSTFLDGKVFTVQSSPISFGSNVNAFTINVDELFVPPPSFNILSSSGSFVLATLEFPSGNLGYQFEVLYTHENTFTIYVGETIFDHTYVNGGTIKNISRGKTPVHIGISTISNGHLLEPEITNVGTGFTNYNTILNTTLSKEIESSDTFIKLGSVAGINSYTDYLTVVGAAITDSKITSVDFETNEISIIDPITSNNVSPVLSDVIVRRYDPLELIIDNPNSYFDLDLIYSDESSSGIGSYAKCDIVVSNDGSVSQFELKSLGSSYGQGEILTIETEGVTGIPTFSSLVVKDITNEIGIFTGSLSTFNDRFGFSVSTSDDGNFVVVGSPYDQDPDSESASGLVYLFDKVGIGYSQVGILTGLYASNLNDNFGYSVAISGDGTKIIVGAPYDEYPGNSGSSGVVYIFDRSSGPTFTNVGIITGSYASDGFDLFGWQIDTSYDGNIIAVSATGDESLSLPSNTSSGVVYIYEREDSPTIGFNTVGIITGLYSYDNGDNFGSSIALSSNGEFLICGAPNDTINGTSGIVYVYQNIESNWTQVGIVTAPNPNNIVESTLFGYSVEINDDGKILAIAAVSDNSGIGGSKSGTVYIYEKIGDQYYIIQVLNGLYAKDIDDAFGSSLSMTSDGKLIAIGTKEDEYPGLENSSGIVYLYERITENYLGSDYVNIGIQTGFYARSLNDNFGTSVKLSPNGTSLIVGSQYDSFTNTGIGTSGVVSVFDLERNSSFDEFQVTIDETFTDSFSGYVFGDLVVFDSFDRLFNGKRSEFPLKIGGLQTTLRARPGSTLELEYNLLVFINDIYQVPNQSYTFSGGSIITFLEAPKQGDKCVILFYYGTKEVDTRNVDILETIKIGDNVTLNSNLLSLQQNPRTVTDIIATDIIETNVYQDTGVTNDNTLQRPVTWCKQLYDKIIDGNVVGKSRAIYEPEIYPRTQIIKSVGIGSTESIFVETVKIFFDSDDEYEPVGILKNAQRSIVIISNDELRPAEVSVSLGNNLRISSVDIIDGGLGYSEPPDITISYPSFTGIGTTTNERAEITCSIDSFGTISSIQLNNPGYGYTTTNIPKVHVGPPTIFYEKIDRVTYEGDFGWVTGIGTTSTVGFDTNFVFELYIPENSYLRESTYGIPIDKSQISPGYYFKISNSNIGNPIFGISALDVYDSSVISTGSSYLDGVYNVESVGIAITEVPGLSVGLGRTEIVRVTVPVASYNGLDVASGGNIGEIGGTPSYIYGQYIGDFSWGRLSDLKRNELKQFNYYKNGISGLSTSATVIRENKLKALGYTQNI